MKNVSKLFGTLLPRRFVSPLACINLFKNSFTSVWTYGNLFYVVVVQLLSHVWLFRTPWTVTCQVPPSSTTSQKVTVKVAQSSPTLFATPQTTQSVEFSWPEYGSGQLIPSPGDLPDRGIEPRSPALPADSLPPERSGKPTNSWSLLKFMPIESMMLSNHLILCQPPLLLPSIFPSVRVFSSESTLHIRWPKYWSFSFRISPSNEY